MDTLVLFFGLEQACKSDPYNVPFPLLANFKHVPGLHHHRNFSFSTCPGYWWTHHTSV